jgi:hypothetical protein
MHAFRAKIAGLPDSAWEETWLGTWSLRQLAAHMAGWAEEMARALERVGRGERPAPAGVDYSDADAWNAKFAATAAPAKGELAHFDSAFAAYIASAKALGDDLFGTKDGRPRIGSRLVDGAGVHHFAEHGAELDAWLKGRA